MKCTECGGEIREASGERVISFPGGRSASVSAEFLRCDRCGEVYLTPGQADSARLEASIKLRREEGLLLPDEIRAIRRSLRLTQRAFETLLGVGRKTVPRWEAGTVFQSRTADNLMRLIRDDYANGERLAEWNGVELAPPVAVQVVAGDFPIPQSMLMPAAPTHWGKPTVIPYEIEAGSV